MAIETPFTIGLNPNSRTKNYDLSESTFLSLVLEAGLAVVNRPWKESSSVSDNQDTR